MGEVDALVTRMRHANAVQAYLQWMLIYIARCARCARSAGRWASRATTAVREGIARDSDHGVRAEDGKGGTARSAAASAAFATCTSVAAFAASASFGQTGIATGSANSADSASSP